MSTSIVKQLGFAYLVAFFLFVTPTLELLLWSVGFLVVGLCLGSIYAKDTLDDAKRVLARTERLLDEAVSKHTMADAAYEDAHHFTSQAIHDAFLKAFENKTVPPVLMEYEGRTYCMLDVHTAIDHILDVAKSDQEEVIDLGVISDGKTTTL